jgi:glycosyltransferase involved in cell wall biosynthesis
VRILFLINDVGYGGAELQVVELAKRMASRGHAVLVCALVRFLEFEMDLRASGIETATLNMEYGRPNPAGAWRLGRLCRRWRPDVIHAHLFAATMVARVARVLAPRPVVLSTSHNSGERKTNRYLAYRLTDSLHDLWTCICSEGLDKHVKARAVSPARARVVLNGIDPDSFAGENRDAPRRELGASGFVWLTVGSFRSEQKDYDNLLAAAADLMSLQEDWQLWIVGDGALRGSKVERARSLGLDGRVRFLGLRKDVSSLMAAADGFVMASAWEGLPIVLLEAGATGLPAVATRVGGNGDILVEAETGFLVPPHDPKALASAMRKIISMTQAERKAMGNNARKRIGTIFHIERIVDHWEETYAELLQRRVS